MENTEEIYTDFARVYDELMDNTPYEMWCNRLDQLIASYGVSRPTRDAEGILDSERNLVVDLGCGTGTLTELLYQKGYDCIGHIGIALYVTVHICCNCQSANRTISFDLQCDQFIIAL